MATPKFAWGIDIGNRALKAIKLVRDGDALHMDDVEVIEHEQVLSNSGDNRETLIQTALANFSQRHQTKGGVVSIGVSGQASFARFIKLPPVEEKKIPEIVKFEAIQQIPFPLEQVEWSYQLFRQADSPDVEVGIFAMRKELVNQQIKYFTDMDMNVQVVQMSPLAVYNAMYYDNRLSDGTTMILDLGAENADLIIAEGESVWLRSVPIGGNNFTEALVKSFKLNFSKAEDLKRNAQTSKYARQIFQAMRPIFADLVAEIQRSIGFYSSVHRDSRIKRIVALGNTFRLPTLQKYLQQNLQIEVERLDAFNAGAPDDGRQAALLNDNIASMAGAYGLALQAMDQGKIGSSLLPAEIKRAKIWQEKTKWFGAAAAVFVLGAGVGFGTQYVHNDSFEAKEPLRGQIDGAVARAEKLDREWGTIESSGGPDKVRIQNVMALRQYRDVWGDLWYDITKALPAQNSEAPETLKAIPRPDRQQVFVESVNSSYSTDIGAALTMDPERFKELASPSQGHADLSAVGGQAGGGGFRGAAPRGGGGGDAGRRNFGREPGGDTLRGEPAPDPNADPNATPGATQRGYLVTIQLTSPSKNALNLVESTVVKNLTDSLSPAKALADGKSYCVGRAMLVTARQVSTDEQRTAAIRAAHDAKREAQARAEQGVNLQGNPSDRGGGGFDRRSPGADRRPVSGDAGRRPSSNFGGRGPARNAVPLTGPGGTDADEKAAKEREREVFADPLFPNESVLEDWVMTVLVAVVLDPQPAQPAEGTGDQPAPQQAAAGVGDAARVEDRRNDAAAAVTATRE
jgi:type IV pilus assembly protein PilM